MSEDDWEVVADAFVDGHYTTVRGAVRTHVVHQHLVAHLPAPPARLVDIGGGAGNQSIPLAAAGYDVTIVDPSPAMLAKAARALGAQERDVRRRVRLAQGSADEASLLLGGATFDGVLCHAVLPYLQQPAPLLAQLVDLAAPGAIFSIIAKNAAVMAARPAHAGDWDAALAAFDSVTQDNGLGLHTRGDTVADLTHLLTLHGVSATHWYGVRLFTDGWGPAVPTSVEANLLAVELEASRRDPYRQLSRLFHLIAKR